MRSVEDLDTLIAFWKEHVKGLENERKELHGNNLLAELGFRLHTPYKLSNDFHKAFPKLRSSSTAVIQSVEQSFTTSDFFFCRIKVNEVDVGKVPVAFLLSFKELGRFLCL